MSLHMRKNVRVQYKGLRNAERTRKLWQKDYVMQKKLEHLYSKDTNERNCLQFTC